MIDIDNNNIIYFFAKNQNERDFIRTIQTLYIIYPNEFNKLYTLYLDICKDYQIDIYKGKLSFINKILKGVLSLDNNLSMRMLTDLLHKRIKYNIDNNMVKTLLHIITEINNRMPETDTGIKYFMNVALNVYANTPIK